jgi:hypothetical protein
MRDRRRWCFTLGSSAVFDAGPFYSESIEAVRRVGCRAVLLVGCDTRNQPAEPLPHSIFTEFMRHIRNSFPVPP